MLDAMDIDIIILIPSSLLQRNNALIYGSLSHLTRDSFAKVTSTCFMASFDGFVSDTPGHRYRQYRTNYLQRKS